VKKYFWLFFTFSFKTARWRAVSSLCWIWLWLMKQGVVLGFQKFIWGSSLTSSKRYFLAPCLGNQLKIQLSVRGRGNVLIEFLMTLKWTFDIKLLLPLLRSSSLKTAVLNKKEKQDCICLHSEHEEYLERYSHAQSGDMHSPGVPPSSILRHK